MLKTILGGVERNQKAQYFVDIKTNLVPIVSGTADLIWLIQVLEHVDDLARYLEECNRILKNGEKLILSNLRHWLYHLDPVDNWRWTIRAW